MTTNFAFLASERSISNTRVAGNRFEAPRGGGVNLDTKFHDLLACGSAWCASPQCASASNNLTQDYSGFGKGLLRSGIINPDINADP